jgi:hypothetical protein
VVIWLGFGKHPATTWIVIFTNIINTKWTFWKMAVVK